MCDGLPRSYLIKQLRSDMNILCHIQRTPGGAEGAEVDVEQELKCAIHSIIAENPNAKQFAVKFCGDGTHVARSAGMCLTSFSVTSPGARMSKAACHHAVAVVKGQESYTLYNTCFRNIFNSINALAASKRLDINGEEMAIDVYLGGDYKFLLMVLGMAGATSNHACIYCRVHSNERGDMAKPEDFYWDDHVVRSMSDISKHAQSNSYGCRSEPLVKLPLTHVVMDELHMMLRITDRLLSNLIEDATDYDAKEKNGILPKSNVLHLDELVKSIELCGVSFRIWETRDPSGRGTGKLEFTSLMGEEKKKLLRRLPSKLTERDALHPNSKHTVIEIWQKLEALYAVVNHEYSDLNAVLSAGIFTLANEWVKLFITLEGKRKGYETKRVTPYMHCLVYHVPRLIKEQLGIKKFSAQGMEKLNDIAKSVHLQHSNKIDACASILKASLRQLHLQDQRRESREYTKRKLDYWQEGIFSKRQRVPISNLVSGSDRVDACNVNHLTVVEVKAKLKSLGVSTRLRNEQKLRALLKQTQEQQSLTSE